MLNRFAIIGGILLLAGLALHSWVSTEQKKEGQLLQEQMSSIFVSENLQKELDKYESRKETRELILNTSIVFMVMGGAAVTGRLLVSTARLLIRVSPYLNEFIIGFFGGLKEIFCKQAAGANRDEYRKTVKQRIQRKKNLKVFRNSGWDNLGTNSSNGHESARAKTEVSAGSKAEPDDSANNAEKTAVLLCDEKSIESQEPLQSPTEEPNIKQTQSNELVEGVEKAALVDSHGNPLKLEDSLKAQTENLERQVAEFGQKAQSIQQAALEYSEPLNGTLRELTQEVSAIREYAAGQQDRVKKLQDGYDWNIIKNFCLRVIRCIDNLENRINQLCEEDIETADLEEVRDELVFALESSGLEQFEPEINSDYHGQEKRAEAVKEREYCDDPNLTGKIAKVIRSGYQYVINEGNVKVVRTAQVKLFG